MIKVRDYLRTNLTDPISGTRASDTRFVVTTYPERKAEYPHVIVYQVDGDGHRVGGNATMFRYTLLISIDVQSKSTKQLDEICDDVLNQMRQGLQTFHDYGMIAMRLPSFPRWNPMPEGTQVHRKSMEYAFYVYVS